MKKVTIGVKEPRIGKNPCRMKAERRIGRREVKASLEACRRTPDEHSLSAKLTAPRRFRRQFAKAVAVALCKPAEVSKPAI